MVTSEFKHWITVYKRLIERDSLGTIKESFVKLGRYKAGVKYSNGDENVHQYQLTNTHNCRFKMRYKNSITNDCVVVFNDRHYEVTFPEHIDRKVTFLHASVLQELIKITV